MVQSNVQRQRPPELLEALASNGAKAPPHSSRKLAF